MADDEPLKVEHEAPPGKHYFIAVKNTEGRMCGWGKAKKYDDAKRVADEQWAKHECYPGEEKGNYHVALVEEAPISHELYCRLTDQAFAIVKFIEASGLVDHVAATEDDDRDLLERAADHVATLNGYQATSTVSDAIWRMLKQRMNIPEKYERSLVE